MLRPYTIQHRLVRFPNRNRVPIRRIAQRRTDTPRTRQHTRTSRIRRILISRHERASGVPRQKLKRLAILRIRHARVESTYDGRHVVVVRVFAETEAGVGGTVCGVGAADVRDAFRVEFFFEAGFADDVDLLVGGEAHDGGDVDGGGVGGAEDLVD